MLASRCAACRGLASISPDRLSATLLSQCSKKVSEGSFFTPGGHPLSAAGAPLHQIHYTRRPNRLLPIRWVDRHADPMSFSVSVACSKSLAKTPVEGRYRHAVRFCNRHLARKSNACYEMARLVFPMFVVRRVSFRGAGFDVCCVAFSLGSDYSSTIPPSQILLQAFLV